MGLDGRCGRRSGGVVVLPRMFSRRTGWDLTPNALSEKRLQMRARGVSVLDLTESNPTRVGLRYPDEIFQALSDLAVRRYEPDPRGLLSAREAVARLFSLKGADVNAGRVMLTASTSEAYSHLFRLLADSGEAILVPRPSYPLFQYLADLGDVRMVPYPLRLEAGKGWRIDFGALESAAALDSAKAVVGVHPNHPTGSAIRREELDRLAEICRRRQMALIADEVFAEYFFSPEPGLPATLLGEQGILVFALGGLSKFLGLPQMKLAWAACGGPEELVEAALARWELIADSFLSVNTPVQRALPEWLRWAEPIQQQIRGRLEMNRYTLTEKCRSGAWRLLPSDGGWNAVLRNSGLETWEQEEQWVLSLLEKAEVLVYPGSFFDFAEPGHGVVSLLTLPEQFLEGIERWIRITP